VTGYLIAADGSVPAADAETVRRLLNEGQLGTEVLAVAGLLVLVRRRGWL
jgi:hypothetical protein